MGNQDHGKNLPVGQKLRFDELVALQATDPIGMARRRTVAGCARRAGVHRIKPASKSLMAGGKSDRLAERRRIGISPDGESRRSTCSQGAGSGGRTIGDAIRNGSRTIVMAGGQYPGALIEAIRQAAGQHQRRGPAPPVPLPSESVARRHLGPCKLDPAQPSRMDLDRWSW